MTALVVGAIVAGNFVMIDLVFGKLIMGESWRETFDGLKVAVCIGAAVALVVAVAEYL